MKLTKFQRPELWNWPSMDDLSNIRQEINRLFEGPLAGRASEFFGNWSPALDLYEDKDNVTVKAELPGMKKEEIDISLHGDMLTISGERKYEEKKEEEGEVSRSERFFGRFSRTVTLPSTVDSERTKASYKDGILTVTLPKSEEAKPRQIEVQTS